MSKKRMRKRVKSKGNGDQITHMYHNWIVVMFFFFKMCILLSKKSILFGSPYNLVKDLNIHDSNMFMI